MDDGATHVILGFWMHARGGVDAAQTWEALSVDRKNSALSHVHAKGAVLMVAAGGATEDIEGFVRAGSPGGATYGALVADWAKDNLMDGVDFDLELSPGNSAPFKDGSFISWAVEASKAARGG